MSSDARRPAAELSENTLAATKWRSHLSRARTAVRIAPVTELLGVVGLYLLAFFQIANKTTALVGLLLMLLAALADTRRLGGMLARSAVAWTTLALFAYVLLRAVAAAWQQPVLANANYHSLTDWLLLPLFPLVALYSRGDSRRIRRLLALALVGSLLGLALRTEWSTVAQAWAVSGYREHWGLPFLSSALYLGTALIGWVAFGTQIIKPGRLVWLRIAAWLAVAGVLAEMLFLTQSRAVLLSLIVILPAMAIVHFWRNTNASSHRQGLVIVAITLIGIAVLVGMNRGPINARFQATSETVAGISKLDLAHVPRTSLGQRVFLYRFGAEVWSQRPVWGWGPGFEAATIRSDAPTIPGTSRRYEHLHDGYLEVLVRFGIVGFGLAGLLACLLVRGLWGAWRRDVLPFDIGLFLLCSALLAALANLTDFRLTHKPYAFYTILVLGLIYGYALKSAQSNVTARPQR